jgi:hypothetical protein
MNRETLENDVKALIEGARVVTRMQEVYFSGSAGGLYANDVRLALMNCDTTRDCAMKLFEEFGSANALRAWLRPKKARI